MTTTDTDLKVFNREFAGRIESAAHKLRPTVIDGFANGYQYDLAAEITDTLTTDDQVSRALRYLAFGHLTSWPLVGGMLDETAAESWKFLGDCADKAAELALRQIRAEGTDVALRTSLGDHIADVMNTLPYSS